MADKVLTTLDLRELPAPEPLLRALVAVDAMVEGSMLRVLTPMRPEPLLELLRSRGFAYSIAALDGGGCAVTLWSEDGAACD